MLTNLISAKSIARKSILEESKFQKHVFTIKLTAVISTLVFSACVSSSEQDGQTDSEAGQLRHEQERVYSKMSEITINNSCNTSADCAIIAVGNMACGGPSSYMAYSTISMGEEVVSELKNLAERTKKLDTKLNTLNQTMSPCIFNSPPTLICENNKCATSNTQGNPQGLKSDIQ